MAYDDHYIQGDFSKHRLANCTISGTFVDVDFTGTDLSQARLSGTFMGVDFTRANLQGAILCGQFTDVDFTDANMQDCDISETNLDKSQFLDVQDCRSIYIPRTATVISNY